MHLEKAIVILTVQQTLRYFLVYKNLRRGRLPADDDKADGEIFEASKRNVSTVLSPPKYNKKYIYLFLAPTKQEHSQFQ